MNRANYEADICKRREHAQQIRFCEVSIGAWKPSIAQCHENVDYWVAKNDGHTAVRGWVTYASTGFAICLTAHSVVRGPEGVMFDITPLENESIRQGMRFVEHLGSEKEFFTLQGERHSMTCPIPQNEWPDLSGILDDAG